MNTPERRAKSTALGKKVNRSRGLLNTEKDFFHGRGLTRGYRIYRTVFNVNRNQF